MRARDDEVLAVVANAPYDQVDVRVVGVPLIDGDPIEPDAEVLLHPADERSRVKARRSTISTASSGETIEAEMMPVVGVAFAEGTAFSVSGPNRRAFSPSRDALGTHR
ncbi:hypothetical protein BUMB_04005 [Candidatus Paraburkholderia calva]|nr:hypothetical protein BUMB_04005 [Candidatus Paraburkholderia calva]